MKRIIVRRVDQRTSDAVFESYFRCNFAGVMLEPQCQKPRIIRDEFGRSKGFGFVYFIDSWHANRVVSRRNHIIDGKRVICEYARNQSINEPKHLKEIFVRNLLVGMTEQELESYFSELTSNDVKKVTIKFDENDRSTGYGFVEFGTSSSVEVVQNTRPHVINNQEILTTRCHPIGVPKHLKRHTTILYVTNYDKNVDKDVIEKYFGDFGKISSVSQEHSANPKYTEIHFVDFDDVDKICLAGKKHIIPEHGCVTVTKFIEDEQVQRNAPSSSNEEDDFCCYCCIIL